MAQKGKGKGVAVVVSVVAIAGVIGYLLYRRYKNKNQKPTDATPSFDVAPPSSGGSSSGTQSSGNPFGNKKDLLKFQKWVIVSKGDKTILGKSGSTGFGDDGQWGSKTASAWAKYGGSYNASVVKDDGTTTSAPLPSYMLPTPSGTGTSPKLRTVVSTSYVNLYQKPSSFLPFNTLPFAPNEILGTSDGVMTYDNNTPYYLVNIPPSLQRTANIPSGQTSGYVKANYVKLT